MKLKTFLTESDPFRLPTRGMTAAHREFFRCLNILTEASSIIKNLTGTTGNLDTANKFLEKLDSYLKKQS